MSVQAPTEPGAPFRLAIEESCLEVLTEAELRAAIAHELGHVWVFTHHPYLQTEELANRIAMRGVSRQTLERVYEKVWKRVGTKGDLALFFGEETTAGLASESQSH
jgi:predicted Zn-dependent protease